MIFITWIRPTNEDATPLESIEIVKAAARPAVVAAENAANVDAVGVAVVSVEEAE